MGKGELWRQVLGSCMTDYIGRVFRESAAIECSNATKNGIKSPAGRGGKPRRSSKRVGKVVYNTRSSYPY